jgi:hypothetical protein
VHHFIVGDLLGFTLMDASDTTHVVLLLHSFALYSLLALGVRHSSQLLLLRNVSLSVPDDLLLNLLRDNFLIYCNCSIGMPNYLLVVFDVHFVFSFANIEDKVSAFALLLDCVLEPLFHYEIFLSPLFYFFSQNVVLIGQTDLLLKPFVL